MSLVLAALSALESTTNWTCLPRETSSPIQQEQKQEQSTTTTLQYLLAFSLSKQQKMVPGPVLERMALAFRHGEQTMVPVPVLEGMALAFRRDEQTMVPVLEGMALAFRRGE